MTLDQLRNETRSEILDCLDIYQEIQGSECSVSVETLVDALRAERAEVARLTTERDEACAQALRYAEDLAELRVARRADEQQYLLLAAEHDDVRADLRTAIADLLAVTAERDRYRAVLERYADASIWLRDRKSGVERVWGLGGAGWEIAKKALIPQKAQR